MAFADSLHAFLNARFREVFGEPARGAGCERQWCLRPFQGASSIDVLISVSHHQAVWLFDPFTPRDCIHRWPIVHHDQVGEAIDCIRARLSAVQTA